MNHNLKVIKPGAISHVGLGGSSKKPWDGKPGVKKERTPRGFSYNGPLENKHFLLKSLIKACAYAASDLRRVENSTKSFYKSVECRKVRVHYNRAAARVMNLAYAFLRGKTYRQCENSTKGFFSHQDFSEIVEEVFNTVFEFCGDEQANSLRRSNIEDWILAGFEGTPGWSLESSN